MRYDQNRTNIAVIDRMSTALASLTSSTSRRYASGRVAVDVDGANSPYKSHRSLRYRELRETIGGTIIENGKYALWIGGPMLAESGGHWRHVAWATIPSEAVREVLTDAARYLMSSHPVGMRSDGALTRVAIFWPKVTEWRKDEDGKVTPIRADVPDPIRAELAHALRADPLDFRDPTHDEMFPPLPQPAVPSWQRICEPVSAASAARNEEREA